MDAQIITGVFFKYQAATQGTTSRYTSTKTSKLKLERLNELKQMSLKTSFKLTCEHHYKTDRTAPHQSSFSTKNLYKNHIGQRFPACVSQHTSMS